MSLQNVSVVYQLINLQAFLKTMPDKFHNRYRIASTRLQNWDYSWDGAYFITICTRDKECYFGNICDDKMHLSHLGLLADVFWYEIKTHAINVELGAYKVMPNHVHGIIILKGNEEKNAALKEPIVETRHALSLQTTTPGKPAVMEEENAIGKKRIQNQVKNTVSSMIGSYKSAVSKHAHRLGFDFEWQGRFHDHIIRDEESFIKISNYILNNEFNWKEDKFYTE